LTRLFQAYFEGRGMVKMVVNLNPSLAGFDESVNVVENTSKKYMPKVKSGLENVGSKVVSTGSKSIPFLQNMTRKFFGLFSKKSNSNKSKSRKNRK
jgi:hypothetical protein